MSTRTAISTTAAQRLAALGREFESLGHFLWAEWVFKQVARRGPPSSTAYYILGRIQAKRGKLEEGKANFARCLAMKPDFYQCRVSFFQICREEHWQPASPRWALFAARPAVPEEPEAWSLTDLHQAVGAALSSQMWYEVGRFDTDDPDACVLDSLETMQRRMKGRAARVFARRLAEARGVLDRACVFLEHQAAAERTWKKRRVRVTRRDGSSVDLLGLRDSDDLTGCHLETIEDGRTRFLPLVDVARVRFGRFGEFTEARVDVAGGASRAVVVPALYYGSRYSTMAELSHGEISMFKELYKGIQIGVGRRVFRGTRPDDGSDVALGIHEIEVIEFMS